MTLIAVRKEIAILKELPPSAGVYRFYSATEELLYVGKARNLRKRVKSYFHGEQHVRIQKLVHQIDQIEITVTSTENEALLLESNLIKALKPRYNVVFRDDKSYPYIVLSAHNSYPQLSYRRLPPGAQLQSKDRTYYFGPYPNLSALRETIKILQKLFRVRSCRDSFFNRRSRPCLQYQIQRCSAPCVGFITPRAYQADVERVRLFLQGKDAAIIEDLRAYMQTSSAQLDYETAARLRNQIADLHQIQQQQAITTRKGDADVIAHVYSFCQHSLYVLRIRSGRVLGGRSYFPNESPILESQSILSAFLSQFYLHLTLKDELPQEIIIAEPVVDQQCLAQAFSERADIKIKICDRPKGDRLRWLQLAQKNAIQSVSSSSRSNHAKQPLQDLQKALNLTGPPHRLECFDISHMQGEAMVAACVVFNGTNPCRPEYRRFNLSGDDLMPGDDYAAIRQALTRHYTRYCLEAKPLPDLLIIDGGKGQLSQAVQVLSSLQISIPLLGIAKGPSRKPGFERFFLPGQTDFCMLFSDPARHLLQAIRDEAHRFAVTGHRTRRDARRLHSILESIPGIGKQRRQKLLSHFRGLQALKYASIEILTTLPGINVTLAKRIYNALKSLTQ